MVQNFHEIAKIHMNVNFRDKNFMIASFFRDYHCATVPVQTVHIVTLPTILTRGVGLEVCKNPDPFRILVLRQRFSICLDALHTRDTFMFLGDF